MMMTVEQIKKVYHALSKYPDAQYVTFVSRENGSGLGMDDIAVFQDRGNIFKKIAPVTLGEEDITDVDLW
jgi:hypothetical protein